ncbi:MAG: type II secretion system protein [Thermodesulfobacteriota bacterium]
MTMPRPNSESGMTVVEVIFALMLITLLSVTYYVLVESYKERRMSEKAAKALMFAAREQEDYFAKEHRYFDAEVSASDGEVYLSTPGGTKTSVVVPPRVSLVMKAVGPDKKAFEGFAFFTGSKKVHQYHSKSGKMTSAERAKDDSE